MQFWSLKGLQSYESIRELQLKLVEIRSRGKIEDTVLLLEHHPVVTQGRGLQYRGVPGPRHMPAPSLPNEISFCQSERGGDLTYHGPGQLVIYPVIKLGDSSFSSQADVSAYLRSLEKLLIRVLGRYSLAAEVRQDATGVWLGERKIASIGIAVRRWVTYHGAALNVVNDLKYFHTFSPCGFAPEVMTNLLVSGAIQNKMHWRAELESKIVNEFGSDPCCLQVLELEDALAICESLSPSHPKDPEALFALQDHP